MTAPRPGWYPDPSGRGGTFRWWDGSDWTDRTRSKLPAQNTRLVALLLGVTLVLSGGVVGLMGWRSFHDAVPPGQKATSGGGNQTPGTPAPVATTGTQQPDGQLDETTRTATLAGGRMVLPGSPYALVTDPVTVPGVFDAMFVANAPVRTGSEGSDTWAATVGLGHIPAGAWSEDDLRGFTRRALSGISEQFFGYHPSAVSKIDDTTTTVSGRPCAKISAEVDYSSAQADNRHNRSDRMVIIGCPDQDGSVIAAISSVPSDAAPSLTALAANSLDTFSLS
ncbi:DUF2510 domain-containing protein [Microlunatus endophyticus]|uniref:DUF2510 domain-containing protein n=1 Tax=Microlunatus endophyticus TaxID=1716077 RepID=UPI0016688AC3|nr:DUF2510 domain-containing protein [Microlunatus endophyticus]